MQQNPEKVAHLENNMENIIELLNEKEILELRIQQMIFGSIEIRESKGKRYIYVHFRNEGISTSKYAGEYSLELNNLIFKNNKLVKEYKKRLREIKKRIRCSTLCIK